MANSLSRPNSTTSRGVRKALRRAKLYRNLQKRVALRRGVSEVTVSNAFKQPSRYRDTVVAILAELERYEPKIRELRERFEAETARKQGRAA